MVQENFVISIIILLLIYCFFKNDGFILILPLCS